MADRAKLFKSGRGQAVRLPGDHRFEDQDEVPIYRQGSKIVLEGARRRRQKELLELAGAAKDFPYPGEPPAAAAGPVLGSMMIAAHAPSLGPIVVTGNEHEFRRVGSLRAESWRDRRD